MGLSDEQAALELIATLQRLTTTMHAAGDDAGTPTPDAPTASDD